MRLSPKPDHFFMGICEGKLFQVHHTAIRKHKKEDCLSSDRLRPLKFKSQRSFLPQNGQNDPISQTGPLLYGHM